MLPFLAVPAALCNGMALGLWNTLKKKSYRPLMTCSFQSMFRPFLVATMTPEMQTVKSKQQETSCHVKKFLVYHRCTYCDYRLKGRYLSLIFKLHVSWTDFKCSDLWLSPLFRLFAQLLHGRLQLARWQRRKAAVKCEVVVNKKWIFQFCFPMNSPAFLAKEQNNFALTTNLEILIKSTAVSVKSFQQFCHKCPKRNCENVWFLFILGQSRDGSVWS